LRQFADPASRVFVVDFVLRRSFWAATRDVCVERDFNRLDAAQGLPPDALENALAGFEAEATPALQEIIAQPGAPSVQAWDIFLNLMALLATRNPVTRQHREAEAARQWYAHFEAATASPERWQEALKRARAHGHIPPDALIEFEAARDFIQNRRFTLEFDRSGFFPDEFADQDSGLPRTQAAALGPRWSQRRLSGLHHNGSPGVSDSRRWPNARRTADIRQS
jgi:hypothetical protein